ncbi:MAG: ATP-binding protein [Gammaproteobacteria bacterium]
MTDTDKQQATGLHNSPERTAESSRHTAMLSAISYAAASLLERDNWEAPVNDLIARLGQATEVSRVVIFQMQTLPTGQLAQTCQFEWVAAGISSIKNNPANQSEVLTATDASGEQWLQRRQQGEIVQVRVHELTGYMRAKFASEGIQSMATVPIMLKGQLWGHIDFDDCVQERIWSAVEIDALKTVALLLGALVERVRLDAELSASERRFRRIAEALPVIIGDYRQGRVLYVSPPAAEMLGHSAQALANASFSTLFADPDECTALLARLAQQQTIEDSEVTYRRADGSLLPAAVSTRHIDYAGHEAAICAITDLSERKAAEAELTRQREALHQADKMSALGSLLAGVAHELNNPLAVVVGQAALLEQDHPPDTQPGQRAVRIRQAAERCVRIVKTFLTMARQKPAEHSAIQLEQVIDTVLELVAYGIRASDIQVTRTIPPGLPLLWGDADQISQVLLNLVINAQQALQNRPGSRTLRLAAEFDPAAQHIVLWVADNGPGIAAAHQQRIFEPFFTTKPVGVGTGIGLSLCHSIVRNHGGNISVSTAPEGGALFRVELPLGQGPASADTVPTASPDGAQADSAQCILVVDDEHDIAELLAEILTGAGYQTLLAHSGREALQQLARQSVDLILSDIRMPDLDGFSFYQALLEQYPQMSKRLIFITGDVLHNADYTALQNVVPMLEKPFDPRQIRRLVSQQLARPPD